MEIQEKIDKIRKTIGKPIPLGTFVGKNGVNFSVEVDKIGKLDLLIYEKGTKNIIKRLSFEENMRFGKAYAMLVTGFDGKLFDYGYELDGHFYRDIYGRVVNGTKEFGESYDVTYSVYDDNFKWEDDVKPSYDFSDMIIYRLHVRGFTYDASSRIKSKGTFKGITEKIPYFKKLGITSVELMPSYEFDEHVYRQEEKQSGHNAFMGNENPKDSMVSKGVMPSYINQSNRSDKINFFGYSKGHYFAPKSSFALKSGEGAVIEFKDMVKKLHRAGIEVIMEFYFTEDVNPHMATDCLRYWVMEYHIDGVRINLDTVPVNMLKSDPILSDIKIIGDRWDIISGYPKGNPMPGEKRHIGICHEGFMVTARRFIKSDENQVDDMINRMKENDDLCGTINFLANHNTFTVMDMVSFERKHNEANGESNRDGAEYNYSWNCGAEGPTRKKKILELRQKQIKNAFALLFLAQGTPMIFAGDEMGFSRMGNNNPYCQDNELNYIKWSSKKVDKDITSFVENMIAYRKLHKILHMNTKMQMMDYKSLGCPDMSIHGQFPWRIDYSHVNRTFALLFNEKYIDKEDMIYVACNMYWEDLEFNIPLTEKQNMWEIDMSTDLKAKEEIKIQNNRTVIVPARSIVVLSSKLRRNAK